MNFKLILCCLIPLLFKPIYGVQAEFPGHWWLSVPKKQLHSWEISPSSVEQPKVILSKRNELGVLSNFAATPFLLDGKEYQSVEGFWQSLKYPESKQDSRYKLAQWPHTRSEVEKMSGFEAKRAGDFASLVMKKHKINWVTYRNQKMSYREKGQSRFYKLIRKAMWQKLEQNPKVKSTLLATGNLILLPDHHQDKDVPLAWRYFDIYMEFRNKLNKVK